MAFIHCCCAVVLFAGIVLDKETSEPLSGVKIDLGDKVVYTDLDGKFETVTAKKTATVQFISYEKDTVNVSPFVVIRLSQP